MNPRHTGYKPAALPLSYVPRGRQQAFACYLVGFDASRRPYAFGFMVHYSTLFRNMCNNRNKLYFSSINLKYSIFTPASVAFLPILSATSFQVSSSKILYLIMRCILCGIVLSHASTSCLIRSAFRNRSFRIFSSRSSSSRSFTTGYARPSI